MTTEEKRTIGTRLKAWRELRRLKQPEAATQLGIPGSTYKKYEMDLRAPGADAMENFARSGININWLLTGDGEMLLADHYAKMERISKEVLGNAPSRLAENPNLQYEAALKRVAEATQATVRISKQFDAALPVEWTSLIQELMAMHGLSEVGAKRVIEALLQRQ